jgi:hypothetical protein
MLFPITAHNAGYPVSTATNGTRLDAATLKADAVSDANSYTDSAVGAVDPTPEINAAISAKIKRGQGTFTGSGTQTTGGITVSHGMGITPAAIVVIPNQGGSAGWWGGSFCVAGAGSSTFNLVASGNVALSNGSTYGFEWIAVA